MNKELEEARKYLEHEVKVYENNKEINQLIGGKTGEIQHKLNITLLNYIENSISKEEYDKIKEENETLKLKEITRTIGKYGEVEVHDAINQVLSKDYISKKIIKEKKQELEKEYKEYLEENSTKAFILKCQLELINEMLEEK